MFATLAAACFVCVLWLPPAAACGLTPPIGANGLPAVCRGEAGQVGVRAGLAWGGTQTRLDFSGESARLLQGALAASFDVVLFERLSLSGNAGASLPGRLDFRGERFELRPGPIVGVGVGYRFFGGSAPFVHTSLTLSWARSTGVSDSGSESNLTFRDYRLGVAVGKTLAGVAAPFVVARYFGAGTEWSIAGHGSDHYRYQVGVGSALALSPHWDTLFELSFLGERRATLGLGYLF